MAKRNSSNESDDTTDATSSSQGAAASAATATGAAEPQPTPAAGTSPAAAAGNGKGRFIAKPKDGSTELRTDSEHVAHRLATEGYEVTDTQHGNRDFGKANNITPRA